MNTSLLRAYYRERERVQGTSWPFTNGADHTVDVKKMIDALPIDQHCTKVSNLLLDWDQFPSDYKALVKQSTAFFLNVGGLRACADDYVAFTTLATRPHIPLESEISASEYAIWHDQVFGKSISEAVQKCGVKTLAPHHVHWVVGKRDSCSWNDIADLPITLSNRLLAQYASQIMEGRNCIASHFEDRQIVSTIAVGHAGADQRTFNAQSYDTAHVHTVARPKELIFPVGETELTDQQKVMYGDNLYYLAVEKFAHDALNIIERSFNDAGADVSFEIAQSADAFARSTFVSTSELRRLSFETVLIATVNLNRHLGVLWKRLAGHGDEESVFGDDLVTELAEVVRCDAPGNIQRFPLTPCFTVVVLWHGDNISDIEITPTLHGPAEISGGSIVRFQ